MSRLLILLLFFTQTSTFAYLYIQNTKVEYVIDGDTFTATINNRKEKIRLKCINAPELDSTTINQDEKVVRVGIESRKHLMELLNESDNIVSLKCSEERDKYGRLTCGVYGEQSNNINLQMVKDGYAHAMPKHCFNGVEGLWYLGWEVVGRILKNNK